MTPMRFALPITLAVLFITIITGNSNAKAWHGIVPMHSTRADVIKMFGTGDDQEDLGSRFSFSGEAVSIIYSTKDSILGECVRNLPSDLVLQVNVFPRLQPTFANLGLNDASLRKVVASQDHPMRSDGFIDDEEGLVISVNGTVEKITYLPTKADRERCPEYYANLETRVNEIFCWLCPTIAVSCPDNAEAGAALTFTANMQVGDPAPKLTFHWTVSAGTIVGGQGTDQIRVDTKNLAGQTITATIEVDGIDPACPRTASCSTPIVPRRN